MNIFVLLTFACTNKTFKLLTNFLLIEISLITIISLDALKKTQYIKNDTSLCKSSNNYYNII